jgi:hypothetical protein
VLVWIQLKLGLFADLPVTVQRMLETGLELCIAQGIEWAHLDADGAAMMACCMRLLSFTIHRPRSMTWASTPPNSDVLRFTMFASSSLVNICW